MKTVNQVDSTPLSTRHRANLNGVAESLEKSRFHLGLALDVLGSEDPYREMDNIWDIHEEIEVQEEADAATTPIEGTEAEVYMKMRQSLASSLDDMKELHWEIQSGLHDHWFYNHIESAVMQMAEARCHMGVLTKIIDADEHTQPA